MLFQSLKYSEICSGLSKEIAPAVVLAIALTSGCLFIWCRITLTHPLIFIDVPSISPWAQDAALYCQNTKVIQGIGDNIFAPKATATRAECATVLVNFIKYVIEKNKYLTTAPEVNYPRHWGDAA